MDEEIEWVEELPDHVQVGSPGKYWGFAKALQKKQGKWATLPKESRTIKGAHATAQNIRRGLVKGFTPKGSFETAVDAETNPPTIYVRYVGDPDEPGSPGEAAKARAWARRVGIEVPAHGRLPEDILEQYRKRVAEVLGADEEEE